MHFGQSRSACGSNDHPTSQLFLQIQRLLCTYSLIKPTTIKGGNVSGGQILNTLMNTTDNMKVAENKALDEKWNNLLKVLVSRMLLHEQDSSANESGSSPPTSNSSDETNLIGEHNNTIANEFDINSILMSSYGGRVMEDLEDHDYGVVRSSPQAQSNFAGYIAFKATKKLTKCEDCASSLRSSTPSEYDTFIVEMNKGKLTYPSQTLFKLIEVIESTFLGVVCSNGMYPNVLFDILKELSNKSDVLTFVGCPIHQEHLTMNIVDIFLIIRARFMVKARNKHEDDAKQKTRELRKQSKY